MNEIGDLDLSEEQLKRKLKTMKTQPKEKEKPEAPKKKTRAEENIEREARLEGAVDTEENEESADTAAQLSIRDRLMRRTEKTVFKTVFRDDLGDFAVETRLMTSSERSDALRMNQMLGQGREDLSKYDEAIKGLKELAAEICVTPGLDEYLRSGDVGDDVVVAMVLRSVYGTLEKVGEATSFRKE
ncbi:MAG TPA: hypothetical protein VMW50_03180 [Dehalococcoidia bacterium]|nr:hypothetical protein [Dehalococcoidia bacterium]